MKKWIFICGLLLCFCMQAMAQTHTTKTKAYKNSKPQFKGVTNQTPRFEVSGEYLYWQIKAGPNPTPLVTTSPTGTSRAQAGVLGTPGVQILLGDDAISFDHTSGGRLSLDYWFGNTRQWGIDLTGFVLKQQDEDESITSDGSKILAIPFKDTRTNQQNSNLIAFPGLSHGSVFMDADSKLWGTEGNILYRTNLHSVPLILFAGVRQIALSEGLDISSSRTAMSDFFPLGITIKTNDDYSTQNQFYGGQLGIKTKQYFNKKVFVGLDLQVALGNNHETIDVNGSQNQSVPGFPDQHFNTGLLTTDTLNGDEKNNIFSTVSEVKVSLGYQIISRLNAFVGYDFLYWTHVNRPGDVINNDLNPLCFPPTSPGCPQQTEASFSQSTFWAQGVTAGLQFALD